MAFEPIQFDGETSRLVILRKTASFSNGVATIDLTSDLTTLGFSTIGTSIIAQVQAGVAKPEGVIRGCARGNDNKSVSIYASSNTYTDTINCNILFEAVK